MNTDTERELKTHVERIVRPIVASEKDKLKMREELYAHAVDAYESETSSGAGDAAAQSRSLARLGGIETTRRELQTTVGWESRVHYYNDRLLRRPEGRPLPLHAARVGLMTAAALLLFKTTVLLPMKFADVWEWTAEGRITVRLSLALAAAFGAGMFIGVILSDHAWRLVKRNFAEPGDYWRLAALFVVNAAALVALGWCFVYAVSGDPRAGLGVALRWLVLADVLLLAGFVACWLDVKERQPLEEWLSLNLDDAGAVE